MRKKMEKLKCKENVPEKKNVALKVNIYLYIYV